MLAKARDRQDEDINSADGKESNVLEVAPVLQ